MLADLRRFAFAIVLAAIAFFSGSRAALAQPAAGGPVPSASLTPKSVHGVSPAPSQRVVADDSDARSRATPRRAIAGFLRAARDGDFTRGADYLDLRAIARERRGREGPELAAMLYRVLTWRVVLDPDQLPDEHDVDTQRVDLDTVEVNGEPADITLVHVKTATDDAWLFSKETVGSIRALYDANQRRWVEDLVPALLKRGSLEGAAPWQWIGLAAALGIAYAVAHSLGALVIALVARLVKRSPPWVTALVRGASPPVRLAVGISAFALLVPYLILPRRGTLYAGYFETTFYIVAAAWLAIAVLRIGTSSYEALLPDDTAGHVANRGLRTRLAMVRRIGSVLIGILASGVALLQFDVVRTVGVSLLASAGIASVLVGFAAQRTLGGIVSGIEMSITQPVRIGDVVVIDSEWGTVERMFLTYLVVRRWDDRRLIVPVSRITSATFENWTRMGSDVLVAVEIFVDYTAPIDDVRAEFQRLCRQSKLWDERKCEVYVIDTSDKAIHVRGLASVDNAQKAFDLQCELREGWVKFIQSHNGGLHMPRGRVEAVTIGNTPDPSSTKTAVVEVSVAKPPAPEASSPKAS